jgi:prepilin-type N-terminal cleavage/methylation domain-containing protein
MTPRTNSRADAGFTLIEVLMALFLLATVALVLADLTCRAVTITGRARRQAVMTALAQERVAQLVGLSWGLGEATTTAPVTDVGTDLSGASPATGGAGLSVSPLAALSVDTPGYSDFADGRGSWIGSGPTVPPGAAFVRRWRIARVPSTMACLAIEVLVDVVDAAGRRTSVPTAAAVRLITVKTRKAA